MKFAGCCSLCVVRRVSVFVAVASSCVLVGVVCGCLLFVVRWLLCVGCCVCVVCACLCFVSVGCGNLRFVVDACVLYVAV